MSSIEFTFDTSQLDALAEKIGKTIDDDVMLRGSIRGVNEVLDRTYDTARKRMNAGIALDDQYIARKLTVEHAVSTPRGTITAAGDLTVLGRYSPKLILKPVKHPGRSKGDKSRGIPPGLKAAGVTVQVSRSAAKPIPHGFLMPLSGGNGLGVFTRGANGKVTHRYGPSVYQLFRATIPEIASAVEDDLEATATDAVVYEVEKAIQ